MSVLYLVRHGQASLHAADYDVLSPVGEEQARHLGAYWRQLGMAFDRVFVGPRRRHRQTHEAVRDAFRDAGLAWPEATELPELDEHCGQEVVRHVLAEIAEEAVDPAAVTPEAHRRHLQQFQEITRRWVRGELTIPEHFEPWERFRGRVTTGLGRLRATCRRGEAIAVFTSGGPVAAAVGEALGLDEEATLELSWRVRNATVTEVAFSGERFSLTSFNAAPHLPSQHLLTWV